MSDIGASEFATLVNSRDGVSVRSALLRFAATVKRQRRIAFSTRILPSETQHDDYDTDDEVVSTQDSEKEDSGSENDDEAVPMKGSLLPPSAKRYKKDEAWKEDSASYNVPFVGTSVSSSGQRDAVVPGEWPTGLLKAYLAKSPLAVELTGDVWAEESSWQTSLKQAHKDKDAQRKGQKLATIVRIAHLRALSELITAALPIEKLGYTNTEPTIRPVSNFEIRPTTDTVNDENGPRFLTEIVTKRLPGVVRLLAEETGHGKGKSGLSGDFSGCGLAVSPALTVLTRLCSVATSIGTARHVARSLEQSIPDGVLRFIVTSSSSSQPRRSRVTTNESTETAAGEDMKVSPRVMALIAGLELAATLTELDDAVVFSCISSSGAKDRKIRPGLLFLALQRGLSGWSRASPLKSSSMDDRATLKLYKVVSRLLKAIYNLLNRSSASKRLLLDLFSRDCLQHVCNIAILWAPPLLRFEDVLKGLDTYMDTEKVGDTAKRDAGIEARRVLFTLMSNQSNSPLLQAIQSAKKHNRINDGAIQLITRAMSNLLDDASSVLEVRRFLLYTINQVPDLLPALFRVLTLPDMTKRPFAFVARLNSISLLLHHGPSASHCTVIDLSLTEINDDTVATLFIPLVLKRPTFTKALQHSNHLVAFEAVKFFGVVVGRCQKFLRDGVPNPNLKVLLTDFMKQLLPDISVLLVALSKLRFDPERKSDILLYTYLCDVIRIYLSVFPTRFDWTKLVPSDAEAFVTSPVLLQRMILSAILVAEAVPINRSVFHSSGVKILLEIVMLTRSHTILREVREILVTFLRPFFLRKSNRGSSGMPGILDASGGERVLSTDDEAMIRFEVLCWVDGISRQSIDEFCALLQNIHNDAPYVLIDIAHAWHAADLPIPVPNPSISALLVRALQRLPHIPCAFGLLTAQVCLRCLLRDPSPLTLAVMIVKSIETEWLSSADQNFRFLVDYASTMVYFDDSAGKERSTLAVQVLKSHFAADSFPLVWLLPNGDIERGDLKLENEDVVSLMFQCRHMASMLKGHDQNRFRMIFRRLLPIGLAEEHFRRLWITAVEFMKQSDYVHCLLLSSRKQTADDSCGLGLETYLEEGSLITNDERCASQSGLLFLYLVGKYLTPNSLSTFLRCLLNRWEKSSRDVTDNPNTRLLNHFVQLACDQSDEVDFLEAVKLSFALLSVWLSLAIDRRMNSFATRLNLSIENLLFLHNSSKIASVALLGFETELLVQRCIVTKRMMANEQDHGIPCCLLSSLISADPIRFTPVFFGAHIEQSTNQEYLCLFRSGNFDKAFCAALDTCENIENYPTLISSLVALVKSRVDDLLPDSNHFSHHDLIAMLFSMTQHSLLLDAVVCSSILNLLETVLKLPAKEGPTHARALEVAVRCCTMGRTSLAVESLSKGLLKHLSRGLHQILRGEKNPTNSITPETLLFWLTEIMVHAQNFKSASVEEMSRWASNTIRSCLRYGMGLYATENLTLSCSCLDFVTSLVTVLHDESSPMRHFRDFFSATMAPETFYMVTSHSQFHSMLKSTTENELILKIVQVLLSCLLGTTDIRFDVGVWNRMLQSHNAGVTSFDTSLRFFLFLYGKQARMSPDLMLHRLRWGTAVLLEDNGPDWEWMVEAIELRRVYATLDNFPFDDVFCPIGVSSVDASELNLLKLGHSTELRDDQRYSPGFLLPHILSALQLCVSTAESSAAGVDPGGGKVAIAQRLCDKGALALAFASLSSMSSVIRKLSLAVIGLFQEVLDSKYAHQLTSWRERPQIDMIVRAVQRALVIRLTDDKGDNILSSYDIPVLPGFSAIFLAKASLLLSRPSDPMYQAANRAFLKTESDGGGFQDLTRLPAFMALFCSSSDDLDRLAHERKFAIELVNFGFFEDESYKLLVSCHCPELLMNAIQCATAMSAIKTDDEIPILFRTLQKLVTTGGEKVSSHLLGRLGLLPWLRCFLLESRTFFKPSFRLCFLELFILVAKKTARMIPSDEFDAATAGLVEPFLRLFLMDDDRPVHGFPSSLLACELLPILTKSKTGSVVMVQPVKGCDSKAARFDGMRLHTILSFLSCLQTPMEIRSGLLGICALPLNCESSDANIMKTLCVKLLDLSMSHDEHDFTLMYVVLQWVDVLAGQLICSLAEREPILFRLLTWRSACCHHNLTRAAWKSCLTSLTNEVQNEARVLLDATSRIDLACWVAQSEH